MTESNDYITRQPEKRHLEEGSRPSLFPVRKPKPIGTPIKVKPEVKKPIKK